MKSFISILTIFILLITSCKAQQPISKLNVNSIKANKLIYNINKEGDKYITIKNSNNKLTSVLQSNPKLEHNMGIGYNMKYDKNLLIRICADAIPLSTLKKMPNGVNDGLFMSIKVNVEGYPIEIQFLIKENSLLTINDLEQIERQIKESKFRISFNNQIAPFLRGSNFINIDSKISYIDMLKAKESN